MESAQPQPTPKFEQAPVLFPTSGEHGYPCRKCVLCFTFSVHPKGAVPSSNIAVDYNGRKLERHYI